MITPKDLENREGVRPGARRSTQPPADQPAADLEKPVPRAIVDAAAALKPPKAGVHCGCCWGRGRDAVIELLEREAPDQK